MIHNLSKCCNAEIDFTGSPNYLVCTKCENECHLPIDPINEEICDCSHKLLLHNNLKTCDLCSCNVFKLTQNREKFKGSGRSPVRESNDNELLENWEDELGDQLKCGYCKWGEGDVCNSCLIVYPFIEKLIAVAVQKERQRCIDIIQAGRNSLATGVMNSTVDLILKILQEHCFDPEFPKN